MNITLTLTGSPTFNGNSSCTIDTTGPDRVEAPSSLLNENQGWVVFRIHPGFASASPPQAIHDLFFWGDAGIPSYLRVYFDRGTTTWVIRSQAAGASLKTVAASFASGDPITVIGAWTTSLVFISVNGAAFQSAARASVQNLSAQTTFDIGSSGLNSNIFGGDFFWFSCGTSTLSDANATTINGFGDTDPTTGNLPGHPSMVWPADSATASVPGGHGDIPFGVLGADADIFSRTGHGDAG